MSNLLILVSSTWPETLTFLLIIVALIHLLFAGAVAKDAGELSKLGQKTALVSGIVWSFSTLLGGVWVAIAYWLIHHSTITRSHT